jgi:hypothetical protein
MNAITWRQMRQQQEPKRQQLEQQQEPKRQQLELRQVLQLEQEQELLLLFYRKRTKQLQR